jgi:hypothetical protein
LLTLRFKLVETLSRLAGHFDLNVQLVALVSGIRWSFFAGL